MKRLKGVDLELRGRTRSRSGLRQDDFGSSSTRSRLGTLINKNWNWFYNFRDSLKHKVCLSRKLISVLQSSINNKLSNKKIQNGFNITCSLTYLQPESWRSWLTNFRSGWDFCTGFRSRGCRWSEKCFGVWWEGCTTRRALRSGGPRSRRCRASTTRKIPLTRAMEERKVEKCWILSWAWVGILF